MTQSALIAVTPGTRPRRLRRVTPKRSVDAVVIRRLLELHAVPNPSILDCGGNEGRMWKGLPYERTTLDRDSSFKPDVVGSWNDLPVLFPTQRFDVIVWDPPHMPNQGRTSMGGKWTKAFGLGGDELRGYKNIHHLFHPFLIAAREVLVPRTGVVLAKIADIVHADERQWSDLAFIRSARDEHGFIPCDRRLGSSLSPPPNHQRQFHEPSLTFWIVLHNGRVCRGPGIDRFMTCHLCRLPMKASRRDKKTCSPRCRKAFERRQKRAQDQETEGRLNGRRQS